MGKIKQFVEGEKGKGVLIAIIIALVALGSFGLGRLSKKPEGRGLKIEYVEEVAEVAPSPQIAQNDPKKEVLGISVSNTTTKTTNVAPVIKAIKTYFASSRGNKYYHLGCSGGKTLKEENKIYFNTEEEAINAGYTKSTSCK